MKKIISLINKINRIILKISDCSVGIKLVKLVNIYTIDLSNL